MTDQWEQYRVEPEAHIWERALMEGGDGYDAMEIAASANWHAVGVWGASGYNLGVWPLVIVFLRHLRNGPYEVVEYVEGDANHYRFPTPELRNECVDGLAFTHWKAAGKRWVKDYQDVRELPPELRGPYRG